MSAYRDAYFKVLCRTVAEWVASRDDVVAFEVAKHGPGAFDSSKRGEHSPDREVVTVKFDILGEPHFAAFVAGSGERPENDTREIIEPLMLMSVKDHIARCEIGINSIIERAKAKADAQA